MTFGQGPRNCIGRRFTETAMKVLLARLVQRFKFDEVIKGKHIERYTARAVITRPKGGMFLKLATV
jgi:cytochrome P450